MGVSTHTPREGSPLAQWVGSAWQAGEPIQTYALLQRLASRIQQTFSYQLREELGCSRPDRDVVSRDGLLPRLGVSVHRSRATPGVRCTLCQRASFLGPSESTSDVGVWVTPLQARGYTGLGFRSGMLRWCQ